MRLVLLIILITSLVFSVELKNDYYGISGELTLGDCSFAQDDNSNGSQGIGRVVLQDREKKENTLVVFISASTVAKKVISEILPLDKKIDLQVKYYMTKKNDLVLENINENYSADGGRLAVEENIRQIGIRKHYPEKYLNYLEIWSATIETSYWQRMLVYAGIPARELEQQVFSGMLATEIDADLKLARELKIAAAPVFLWQNQELITDLAYLKQLLLLNEAEK